jgi:hypothetical protein
MTVAARERSTHRREAAPQQLFDTGSRSLEDVLAAVSQTLATRGIGSCLVCGGTLVVAENDGAARCTACSSCLD